MEASGLNEMLNSNVNAIKGSIRMDKEIGEGSDSGYEHERKDEGYIKPYTPKESIQVQSPEESFNYSPKRQSPTFEEEKQEVLKIGDLHDQSAKTLSNIKKSRQMRKEQDKIARMSQMSSPYKSELSPE